MTNVCIEIFLFHHMVAHHAATRKDKDKEQDSVVYDSFHGRIEVLNLTKQLVSGIHELQHQSNGSSSNNSSEGNAEEDGGSEWKETLTTGLPFTVLSVDLPPCPLFRDSAGGLVIPQLPLFEVPNHIISCTTLRSSFCFT